MKILFICSKETDYLQDLTYAGLAEKLGKESILVFPNHWQYQRKKRFFWAKESGYPKNLGFVEPELQGYERSVSTISPATGGDTLSGAPQGFPSVTGSRALSEAVPEGGSSFRKPTRSGTEVAVATGVGHVKSLLRKRSFDLVILGACKPDALMTLWQLQEWIAVPWLFVDGGDRNEVGGDFEREGGAECFNLFSQLCRKIPPHLIFKREVRPGMKSDSLFPLPFSVNPSKVSVLPYSDEKKYQVIFWAVESSATRKEVFKLLKGRYDCDRNGSLPDQKFKKYSYRGMDYFKALNRAQIGLSFRGVGFDTLRYWEIPACGSLLVSEKPLIDIPNDFADKRQAVFCRNDCSNLLELIDYYLSHEKEAKAIAVEGQKHLLKFHTHIHRAEYLLDIVESKLHNH